jgi:hypothetical protein
MGEEIVLGHDLEPDAAGVAQELLARHAVLDWRSHRRLALLEVDVDEAAAAAQRTRDPAQEAVPFVDWAELRNVILPIANIIGGFFLPVLYGALGTCAYILRAIYSQMCERSFDPRQNGEFIVRIFLGMLSGITLQWIFVRDGSSVPGGITPAVLAFIGGYSVEVLFTAMDRLLTALTGSIKTTAGPARSASAPPAPEPPGAGT